jgi:uncharacterized membrane protein SpoIIM required for sporulation
LFKFEADMSSADSGELRSARFQRERETSWRRLEDLLHRKARAGLKSLSPSELRELPALYRASLSSLSVARAIALDRSLISYLESLSQRAYFEVYAPRLGFREVLARYFGRDLPQAVRTLAPMTWLAALLFLLGVSFGWLLVLDRPDFYLSIVPRSLAGGRTPFSSEEALRSSLYQSSMTLETLQGFALFLFRHNASVTLLCFGLGFALGIPTILLSFYNGAVVGAMLAVFQRRNLLLDIFAWLSVHGTTELAATFLAAGAGLSLARGVLLPRPRQSRLNSLTERGRAAGIVALGAILLLFVAAILEGIVRQLVTDPYLRLAIGWTIAAGWVAYFTRTGREPA